MVMKVECDDFSENFQIFKEILVEKRRPEAVSCDSSLSHLSVTLLTSHSMHSTALIRTVTCKSPAWNVNPPRWSPVSRTSRARCVIVFRSSGTYDFELRYLIHFGSRWCLDFHSSPFKTQCCIKSQKNWIINLNHKLKNIGLDLYDLKQKIIFFWFKNPNNKLQITLFF